MGDLHICSGLIDRAYAIYSPTTTLVAISVHSERDAWRRAQRERYYSGQGCVHMRGGWHCVACAKALGYKCVPVFITGQRP